MRFFSYGRKSVFSDKSDSIDNQFRMNREYCESKFSGQVDSWQQFSDEDFTGANTSRPDLQRMLSFIKGGFCDVLVVYQLDRLSRDVRDFANIYALLEEHGVSGSGKSTILKLLMRFWDVQTGRVSVDGADVREIPTKYLRDMESYVTQETHLFHDSIANNIAIAKPGATREEIMEAAKKASIHDFIMTLPNGYDTEVGELGDTLSGGEKQRIGIARAFLHDASMILLDEPTSNLDSLNEGIILKSLKESAEEKTIVLVSHRVSTMNVADVVYEMENGRIS